MTGELLPEVLLLVFPYVPPEDFSSLCRVSRRWKTAGELMFSRYLAWRKSGWTTCLHNALAVASSRTAYHLHDEHCYGLARESVSGFSSGDITVTRIPLSRGEAPEGVEPEGAELKLFPLKRVMFAFMHDSFLFLTSTDVVEVHSLSEGRLAQTLHPSAEQKKSGSLFTNIISCHGDFAACKMRPPTSASSADRTSCVNLYDLKTGAIAKTFRCCLTGVRTCRLTTKYVVLKTASVRGAPDVLSISLASGELTRNCLHQPVHGGIKAPLTAVRRDKDVSLIGVDKGNIAYFLLPRRSQVPSNWKRWSQRLLQSKPVDISFEVFQWDIDNNAVRRCHLAVSGIPRPSHWPAAQPFALTLDRDKVQLADDSSVLVCYFVRRSEATREASGVVCVHTKSGHLLSVIDPSQPSFVTPFLKPSFWDVPQALSGAEDEPADVVVEFLGAHHSSQQLLFSVTTLAHKLPVAAKVVAYNFKPGMTCLTRAFL
ncbi:hypothetical protein DIPPA_11947 [Diplonema papillatum]|nr:hypothetical protein DIPPA_11947 [Diplonema papillatum]